MSLYKDVVYCFPVELYFGEHPDKKNKYKQLYFIENGKLKDIYNSDIYLTSIEKEPIYEEFLDRFISRFNMSVIRETKWLDENNRMNYPRNSVYKNDDDTYCFDFNIIHRKIIKTISFPLEKENHIYTFLKVITDLQMHKLDYTLMNE